MIEPNSVLYLVIPNIKAFMQYQFREFKNLRVVYCNASDIDYQAFSRCHTLYQFHDDSLKTLQQAFDNCFCLSSINLNYIQIINRSFIKCKSLQLIELKNNSVHTIDLFSESNNIVYLSFLNLTQLFPHNLYNNLRYLRLPCCENFEKVGQNTKINDFSTQL